MSDEAGRQWVHALAREFPWTLNSIPGLDETELDLPHVFLGTIALSLEKVILGKSPNGFGQAPQEWQRLINWVEAHYSPDSDQEDCIENLVAVSFVEDLLQWGIEPAHSQVMGWLPPKLAATYQEMSDWRPHS